MFDSGGDALIVVAVDEDALLFKLRLVIASLAVSTICEDDNKVNGCS